MNYNNIYEKIIEVDGECFKSGMPQCQECPFMDKCLSKIINEAAAITGVQRVKWALDKLVEEVLFNDNDDE